MGTSATTSKPRWLAGVTYDGDGGNDLRCTEAAYFFDQGINQSSPSVMGPLGGVLGGNGLNVLAAGGMTVTVNPGHFMVPNSGSATAGVYVASLVSSASLTLASADPSNPRIDLVVACVDDLGTSSSEGYVELVTGTASSSPSVPAAPANSITLAQIAVAANASTITQGNISDQRTYAVAAGGVLRAPKGSVVGYAGMIGFDPGSGVFYHNINSALGTALAYPLRTLPFAPVHLIMSGGSYTLPDSSGTVVPGLSTTVTCDGLTDLKLTYHVAGFTGITSASTYVAVQVLVDGTVIDQTSLTLNATVNAQGGFTGIGYTSSVTSTTPSAAAHTVEVQAWSNTGSPQIHGFSGLAAPAYLRVEPVNL